MSFIFLHVGQCGNQLGQAFWEEAGSSKWTAVHKPSAKTHIAQKTRPSLPNAFMPPIPYTLCDGFIPCVLVDAEPKPIRSCLTACGSSRSAFSRRRVREECIVTERMGRGSNWAYGYHGRSRLGSPHEQSLLDRTMEAVRKSLERCDRFGGFVMFHSIAGGTGSGLGSALLEHLRMLHPVSCILSVVVTPFSSGETPLQHLNSALSLAWLQKYSDAVLLLDNDSVMEQVVRQRKSPPLVSSSSASATVSAGSGGWRKGCGHSSEVSMADMNGFISGALCNLLMPLWKPQQGSANLSGQEPWELVRSVCPDPACKLLSLNHIELAHSASRWSQMTSHLTHKASTSLWSDSKHPATKAQTSSLLLVARGSPSSMDSFFPVDHWTLVESKLKNAYGTVEWNPFPVDCWKSHEKGFGHLKMATVVANSSVVLDYLAGVRERSKVMWEAGAYLHWYERYGCEKDTFVGAFATMDDIINTYSDM